MALIIYPLEDWDAFISVADCNTFLANNVPSGQREAYDALVETDKEIYIRQATIIIKNKVRDLPETLEDNLKNATAYLVNYSIGIDMLNSNGDDNIKEDEVTGVVRTEYFRRGKKNNDLPDIVSTLLKDYGVTNGSNFRIVRG